MHTFMLEMFLDEVNNRWLLKCSMHVDAFKLFVNYIRIIYLISRCNHANTIFIISVRVGLVRQSYTILKTSRRLKK